MRTLAGATPAWHVAYAHDAVGNRTSTTLPGLAKAYEYDVLSQLVRVERTQPAPVSWSYTFDSVVPAEHSAPAERRANPRT
jgi:YD repeat-containing protein